MAFLVIKLSETKRKFLNCVLILLNLTQIFSGTLMLMISIYVNRIVAPMLYSERAEINFVFIIVGFFGLTLIIIYSYGIRISWKCLKQAHKKSTGSLVFSWICGTFYINSALLITAGSSRKVYKHIIRSIKHAFYVGMQQYLKNEMWKVAIDHLQYNMKCCGIESYQDWHEITWLNHYHLDQSSQLVRQLRIKNTNNLPVTPFSCCRLHFPMQCLHDPIQQIRLTHIWTEQPSLIEESLNTVGCLNQLRTRIYSTIVAFILLTILCCIIQIVVFLLIRLLYTSSRNAAILDDRNGTAPGWIFGRGDFGINRGKTLLQIMEDKNKEQQQLQQREQEELQEFETSETNLLTSVASDEMEEDSFYVSF